jgi:hypothetical protein
MTFLSQNNFRDAIPGTYDQGSIVQNTMISLFGYDAVLNAPEAEFRQRSKLIEKVLRRMIHKDGTVAVLSPPGTAPLERMLQLNPSEPVRRTLLFSIPRRGNDGSSSVRSPSRQSPGELSRKSERNVSTREVQQSNNMIGSPSGGRPMQSSPPNWRNDPRSNPNDFFNESQYAGAGRIVGSEQVPRRQGSPQHLSQRMAFDSPDRNILMQQQARFNSAPSGGWSTQPNSADQVYAINGTDQASYASAAQVPMRTPQYPNQMGRANGAWTDVPRGFSNEFSDEPRYSGANDAERRSVSPEQSLPRQSLPPQQPPDVSRQEQIISSKAISAPPLSLSAPDRADVAHLPDLGDKSNPYQMETAQNEPRNSYESTQAQMPMQVSVDKPPFQEDDPQPDESPPVFMMSVADRLAAQKQLQEEAVRNRVARSRGDI